MLSADTLLAELERFCDAAAPSFDGWPTTRVHARERWSHAFAVYLAEVEDFVVAASISPARASIKDTFASDVEHAFLDQLRLDTGMSARTAAEDFGDAWRAGLRAIRAGVGGALPPDTTQYMFSEWTPTPPPPLWVPPLHDIVDDRRDHLVDQLAALFSRWSIDAPTRLMEIARAFHVATFELTATSDVSAVALTYR
jgi:hypothetical protein